MHGGSVGSAVESKNERTSRAMVCVLNACVLVEWASVRDGLTLCHLREISIPLCRSGHARRISYDTAEANEAGDGGICFRMGPRCPEFF